MPTQKLHKSKPAPPQLTDTEASKLCAKWQELEEERIKHDRAARACKSLVDKIEAQLLPYTKAAGKLPVRELPRFRLEVIQVAGSFSFKDELIEELGEEEVARRKALVPDKDDLKITETKPARAKKKPAA